MGDSAACECGRTVVHPADLTDQAVTCGHCGQTVIVKGKR